MSRYGQKWTKEETILAFYYYCQIPFGRIHSGNPEIIRIANLLGRTPGSVGLKMANLGHFDPELRGRNITGLSNASKTDKEVVEQFINDWEGLAYQAHLVETALSPEHSDEALPEGLTVTQEVQRRLNQQFFREAVLSSYQGHCCITGISVPSLLIASHIKPWADSNPKTERTNPRNGLCLNALHDRAFDQGLITVLPDYTIRVSSKIKSGASNEGSIGWLLQCDGNRIQLPNRFLPDKKYLEYHNDVIFVP